MSDATMCVRGFLGFLGPRSPVAVDLAAADVTSMSQYRPGSGLGVQGLRA